MSKESKGGGFANLVASMKHHHEQSSSSTEQDREIEKGRKPSKGLPATGLAVGADKERVDEHRRASEDKLNERKSTIGAKDVSDAHAAPPSHFTQGPGVLPSETSRIPDARTIPNVINFPRTDSPEASSDEAEEDGPKEKTEKRTRENTLPAENGARPGTLQPAKDEEEKPGNRNEIWLKARGGDLHYHQHIDHNANGAERGPVLGISHDGEHELPADELQKHEDERRRSLKGKAREDRPISAQYHSESHVRTVTEESNDTVGNGTWRSAMSYTPTRSPSNRPAMRSRWSTFRESTAEDSESDTASNKTPRRPRKSDSGPAPQEQDEDDASEEPQPAEPQPANPPESTQARENAQRKWSALKGKLLPSSANHMTGARTAIGPTHDKTSQVAPVPITTELLSGQLGVMMLKTWLDRDEDGRRAVPVLLGNMRFRVCESVGTGGGSHHGQLRTGPGGGIFKVECEYGDGAVKWVIYRELKDFFSLHSHYKAANFGSRVAGLRSSRPVKIPDFPKFAIPYLNKISGKDAGKLLGQDMMHRHKEIDKDLNKAQQAQAMRSALETYLVELIRAVVFRPESNRLCKFFELSALTVSLAPRGGFQGKAGYLKILGSGTSRRANQPGLTPTSWKHSREPKWCIVRDSYIVATDGPESTDIYEVFLIDSDFEIERPKRALRQGLNLVSGKSTVRSVFNKNAAGKGQAKQILHDEVDTDNPVAADMILGAGEARDPKDLDGDERDASQHTFYITNSQRRLKMVAKNVRQMNQFIASIERAALSSPWHGRNRFDSFAPVRMNVAAQWLVDGRDYFWNLSRAINMAKDKIYIHDWWISPELYLRRPGDERYRLDNLLKRKAEEGVKIHIIIYNEVSAKTTPTDSGYTKRTLTGLHPNIYVQRSPSHFQTGTFYWSHHEKLCVIDDTIAFMGGLDLCFGRWDTSQHVLIDDDFEEPNGPNGPVWHGKDYSNERVVEFHTLDKPFEDSIDRNKVPRMPWHDVGLQIVGQPARDLCRHFLQRWNYLIRTKNHTRLMPFLLPPADFTEAELGELELSGTCEVQICRSCGPWSMATNTKIEHSVQNAYLKAIQLSEHFVYIENQFFITSTVVDGIQIENQIGDALVERIIKAYKEETPWRACIVIPLLPGYTYPIDSNEASSVRLILECQNRTISRGTHSIFSRLRKEGIDPNDYITFFSLRGWGKFKTGALTTEQVYIHGKTMIIDDRMVICGSANINERSQRGDRDSELVAVVRDTDMIDSEMAGKPYKVGRYAHSLRVRLMREHLGVDVDAIEEDQLMTREPIADEDDVQMWDPDDEQDDDDDAHRGVSRVKHRPARDRLMNTFTTGIKGVTKGMSENAISNVKKGANVLIKPVALVAGSKSTIGGSQVANGQDNEREDFDREGQRAAGFAGSMVPTIEEKVIFERRPSAQHTDGKPLFDLIEDGETDNGPEEAEVPGEIKQGNLVNEDQDGNAGGAPKVQGKPDDREKFGAPANAVPDDDSTPTRDTKRSGGSEQEKAAIAARKTLRKHLSAKVGNHPWTMPTPTPKIYPDQFRDPLAESFWDDQWMAACVHNTEIFRKVFRCIPDDLVTSWASYKAFANHAEKFNKVPQDVAPPGSSGTDHEPVKVVHNGPGTHGAGGGGSGGGIVGQEGKEKDASTRDSDVVNGKPQDPTSPPKERKPSGHDEAWHDWEREQMEELLGELRGHLVVYPTRFLEAEDLANNFLFNADKILPLPIYD